MEMLQLSLSNAGSWLVPVLAAAVVAIAGGVVSRLIRSMQRELDDARTQVLDRQQVLEMIQCRSTELQVQAESDPLTRLPNRRQLNHQLDQALARARSSESFVGVFFIDLDNFKAINDNMDHRYGDRVLVAVSERLQEVAAGFGFAARFGGDEFTVVYADAANPDPIRTAGLELIQAFRKPLIVDGSELHVSISVGLAVYPEHCQDAEGLLHAADAALARAKAQGRDRLSLCTPELLRADVEKHTIGRALQRALHDEEFELLFQPELSLEDMRVERVEALLRWRRPAGRVALPDEFLTAAEECGLMPAVGDWMLRHAVAMAARWHHGVWPDVRVSVNIAPMQLIEGNLAERLRQLLQQHRLPARCLGLELTEAVLRVGPAALSALRNLRGMGLAIVLDDFGSGRSALSALEELPITGIKLDRSLIAGIDRNERAPAIARALINMCHGLGLNVTAEGVERRSQLLWLRQHAVSAQGNLLGAPLPAEGVPGARDTVAAIGAGMLLEGRSAFLAGFKARPVARQMRQASYSPQG